MERITGQISKDSAFEFNSVPIFLIFKLGDKNRPDWIPYSSKILWSVLRCVEPWRLQVLPFQERVLLLQGPHHITAPHPAASSATGQRTIQTSAYKNPTSSLSFSWEPNGHIIRPEFCSNIWIQLCGFKTLIVNYVLRLIDIDYIG